MVDRCDQRKVARMNSKSSSRTSTIIEYFRTSCMNSDMSWVVDYSSSLREKEENFDNLCYESSQPTVEYHEEGSQDSNNVETQMNLQACIGKPLPPQKGKKPASSTSSSGGSVNSSSNPVSINPRTKSN